MSIDIAALDHVFGDLLVIIDEHTEFPPAPSTDLTLLFDNDFSENSGDDEADLDWDYVGTIQHPERGEILLPLCAQGVHSLWHENQNPCARIAVTLSEQYAAGRTIATITDVSSTTFWYTDEFERGTDVSIASNVGAVLSEFARCYGLPIFVSIEEA